MDADEAQIRWLQGAIPRGALTVDPAAPDHRVNREEREVARTPAVRPRRLLSIAREEHEAREDHEVHEDHEGNLPRQHDPAQAILEDAHTEVNQQPGPESGCTQIRDQLSAVNLFETSDCFQFHDDKATDIQSILCPAMGMPS